MRHDDTSLITAAPSEEGSEARPLFSPRALWVIFGGGTISLLLAALLIWFGDPSEEVHSIDADSFSVSALGHQAFKETLLAHDISVHQGRYRPHERVGRGEALVVAEPHLFYDDHTAEAAARLKKYRVMLAASPRTLIVLPEARRLRLRGSALAGDVYPRRRRGGDQARRRRSVDRVLVSGA